MKNQLGNNRHSGIYAIENLINGKLYIGKTKNFTRRYSQYVYDFSKNRNEHINNYLMNAFNKYGFSNFKMYIIEICDEDMLSEKELHYMNFYESTNKNKGYNLRMDSSSGMICHERTRAKITRNLLLQHSLGQRDKHSSIMKSYWNGNDKRRAQMSKYLTDLKTKYTWFIMDEELGVTCTSYKELKDLGFGSVTSVFHRKKVDKCFFKDHFIWRVKL